MKKNGLIALISILAAAAGAIAAIFAITKKNGNKKETQQDDFTDTSDHIEIDIHDEEDDYGVTEEEYQSESAQIPEQETESEEESMEEPQNEYFSGEEEH